MRIVASLIAPSPREHDMLSPGMHNESSPPYEGRGTAEDPYVVKFKPEDPANPMNWLSARKWLYIGIATISVFAVTMTSSAYSVSSKEITREFHSSSELFSLGIALYVLGFAVGPPLWAPMSELYGRRLPFVLTLSALTAFVGATAGCKNMASLLVLRFISGT